MQRRALGRLGRLHGRRAHLYCVGTAKSGTHSVREMFSRSVRAAHEPQASELIDKFFAWQQGRIGEGEMIHWVRARDQSLALEVDSSWLNILILEWLVREFSDARFVLTIRDCYSWLNSEFNRVLRPVERSPQRVRVREFLYQREHSIHGPEERILKEKAIYPIANYLSRWTAHNEAVLAQVPKERLLIVRTDEITQRAHGIADFAGLPRWSVRLHRTHEYRNPIDERLIKQIDSAFLERKVEQHCRPLMSRFFPEIKSLDDLEL
jgi:hypothetical protein